METIFEKIMLVEIKTTRRRMEAITDLSTDKNILLKATYSGVLVGLESALKIYKESLQVDIEQKENFIGLKTERINRTE